MQMGLAEYVLIISMGMQNVLGGIPGHNNFSELLIPMENEEVCEERIEDFTGIDLVINGYQIYVDAECRPGYDAIEPDVETWQECQDQPEFDKPEYCKETDFPILDNSTEKG